MAQNIYDDPQFFAKYSQLPRQLHGLDGAPEWSAVKAMLPPLQGKRVADLGCGFGWASRWMRENGATSVVGYDLSENMINRARADTRDDAIEYRIADLNTLELPARSFELVYSALTFHYVEDLIVSSARCIRPWYLAVRWYSPLSIRSSWPRRSRTGSRMAEVARHGR